MSGRIAPCGDGYEPYNPEVVDAEKLRTYGFKRVLSNGGEVFIGVQPDHPEGPCVFHRTRRTLPDGRKVEMKFALSFEAARAFAAIYKKLGIA